MTVAQKPKEQTRETERSELLDRACEIIVAFLNKNEVEVSDIPEIIKDVHRTLLAEYDNEMPATEQVSTSGRSSTLRPHAAPVPAIPVEKSITPDFIICLEDGKHLKTMRRYIKGRFGLTPEKYREKWGLSPDYPMVAPNYAAKRSKLAKKFGLGQGQVLSKRGRRK